MNKTNMTDSIDMKIVPLLQTGETFVSTLSHKRTNDLNYSLHEVQALLMQCPTATFERIYVSKEHDMIEDDIEPNRKGSQCTSKTRKRLSDKIAERRSKTHKFDNNDIEPNRKGGQCKNKTRKRLSDKIAERRSKIHKLDSIDTNKNKTGKQKLKSKKCSRKKQKEKKISDKFIEQNNVIYILDDKTKDLNKSFLQTKNKTGKPKLKSKKSSRKKQKEKRISDKLVEQNNVIYILNDETKDLNKSFLQTIDTITMVSNEDNEDADVDVDADDDIAVDLRDQTNTLNGVHMSPFQRAVTASVDRGKIKSEFYQFKDEPTDSSTGTSYDNVTCKMNNEDISDKGKIDTGKINSSNLLLIRHLKDMTTYTENENNEVTPVSCVANLKQITESAPTIYVVNQNDVEAHLKSILPLDRNHTTYELQTSARSNVCDQLSNGRIVLPRVDDINVFNNLRNCKMCRQQQKNLEGLWVAV